MKLYESKNFIRDERLILKTSFWGYDVVLRERHLTRSINLGSRMRTLILFVIFFFVKTTKVYAFADISDALFISHERVLMVNDENSTLIDYHFKNQTIIQSREIFPNKEEADFESMALYNDHLYLTGSHSLKRKKVKAKFSKAKNLKRISQIKRDSFRFHVVKLHSNNIFATNYDTASLEPILLNDAILAPFLKIPSKENGIDIEAMTITPQGKMYFGFRGPVLRENMTPILSILETDLFSGVQKYHLDYINLEGLGIRELAKVNNGFLILAGPNSDLSLPHKIYFWDGITMLPANDSKAGNLKLLKTLNRGEKAEGISVVSETPQSYELLISYDGKRNGGLHIIKIDK